MTMSSLTRAHSSNSTSGDSVRISARSSVSGALLSVKSEPSSRVSSIDAYRGFVVLLMMTEVISVGTLAELAPANPILAVLARQQVHAEWTGYTLWDLVQPSFSFL